MKVENKSMSVQSVKSRNFIIMVILGLTCVAAMNDMVIIPVAGNLFEDFADTGVAVLNFILSGPVLISAVFSLLCGKLMYVMRKKTLMILAYGVFTIASIFCNAVHSAYYMVVMRILVGASMGMIGVVAVTIIADVFVDEKARSSMMGIYNAIMALIGAALGGVAGLVAANAESWRAVFRIYLVSIPIFILIMIFLPKEAHSDDNAAEETSAGSEKMPWGKLLSMEAAFVVYSIIYCIVYYQISMIVIAKGIGDVSLTGFLSALGTVGSFVACAAFGLYFNVLKRFTVVIGYASMALCYWLLYSATAVPAAVIACTVLGASYGLGLSFYMMYSTMIVPPVQIPLAISITTFAMGIGAFLSTYCATLLQSITKAPTVVETIPILIIVMVVGTVLSLIISFVERRNQC
jgi:MFS family permease